MNYIELDAQDLEYVTIAEEDEIANGERLIVDIDDYSLVIFNIAGKLFAIGDVCSHDDGPIGEGEMEDYQVVCPRHGAHFDVKSGKVLSLPAIVDIPAYPVRIANGQIEVGIPKDN